MHDSVLLCAKAHNFDRCVDLARQYNLGLEVQTFAYAAMLDGDWEATLERYLPQLARLRGPITMHGPFIDMASGTPDPLVKAVVDQRVAHALDIAERLGARTAIFHANFIASLRNQDYRLNWTANQVAFWTPHADRASRAGITIALENMWEFDPDIIGDVVRQTDHPALRACLDVGHAHLFSDLPIDTWLDRLGAYIVHVHLNNNGGEIDQHRALDDGVIDYDAVLPALRRLPHPPMFSLEIDRVEDMRRSLSLFHLPDSPDPLA